MKKLLWKPAKISWQIHFIVAIAAIIGLILIEALKVNIKQPYYKQKVNAAKTMKKGMEIIKKYRLDKIGSISKKIDPMKSGMIGKLQTPITSSTVDIDAKLTTINPNWAAVLVSMLKEAKIKNGSTVAVSFTGSFPAINLAVLSAAKELELKLIIITSAASSTWGANIPEFTWLDMERLLYKVGLFDYKSVAASFGGVKDQALGISEEGKKMLREAIARNGVMFIGIEKIRENIDARMDIYLEEAKENQIAAYINVGGGTISVGTFIGKRRFEPGLNLRPPFRKSLKIDSVMTRFAKEDIPVINMNYMKTIAGKYGLPEDQREMPRIGIGEIYYRLEYNKILVAGVLIVLLFMLYLFIKQGFGYRIFISTRKESGLKPPEHMV